jgi:hypothetical protein
VMSRTNKSEEVLNAEFITKQRKEQEARDERWKNRNKLKAARPKQDIESFLTYNFNANAQTQCNDLWDAHDLLTPSQISRIIVKLERRVKDAEWELARWRNIEQKQLQARD